MNPILIILLSVNLGLVVCELKPSKKCALSDSVCIKTTGQELVKQFTAGEKDAGVDVLDVMHFDKFKYEIAGLKVECNSDISGFSGTVIDKIEFDDSKKKMLLSFHSDVIMKGQYKADGKVTVLDMSGNGDYTIAIKNLVIDITAQYKISKNADGKDIIDITSYKYKFDIKDNIHFELTGLFDGNKELSDTMLTFLNENWKPISDEYSGPLLEKPIKKVVSSVKSYLKSQPMEDLVAV